MTQDFTRLSHGGRITTEFLRRTGAARTPWYVWPLALAVGVLGAQTAASPAGAGALIAGGILLTLAALILSRPILGFALALAFYPAYTLLRGIAQVYNLPLPYTLLGVWPEVLLCVMAAGLILRDIRAGKRRFRASDIPVALMAAGSIYALSLTLSDREWSAALYGAHGSITSFFFYFVARSLDVSREDLRRLIRVWLISFALLALFSLWDYFYRPNFIIEVAIKVRDQFWKTWEPHVFFKWYPRMQSLLFGEQLWGTICGMAAVYCAALWGQQYRIGPRRWILPVYALALAGLTLSMSRGALVGWSVASFVLFWIPGRHKRLLGGTALVGVALLAFLMVRYGESEIVRTVTTRVTALLDFDNRLAYDRVDQWKVALEVFPLFPSGRGLGRAGATALFHNTGDAYLAVPDGGYFKILAEGGVPGMALFIIGGLAFLPVLWGNAKALRRRDGGDYALALACFCLMCGLLCHNLGGNIFDAYYVTPLFFLLCGLATARREAWESEDAGCLLGAATVPVVGGRWSVVGEKVSGNRQPATGDSQHSSSPTTNHRPPTTGLSEGR